MLVYVALPAFCEQRGKQNLSRFGRSGILRVLSYAQPRRYHGPKCVVELNIVVVQGFPTASRVSIHTTRGGQRPYLHVSTDNPVVIDGRAVDRFDPELWLVAIVVSHHITASLVLWRRTRWHARLEFRHESVGSTDRFCTRSKLLEEKNFRRGLPLHYAHQKRRAAPAIFHNVGQ